MIAFVSDDCPVSMVATVIKARQFADQNKGGQLIVAPLQQLSETHLLMNRMVSNGNMLFINDEQWRKKTWLRRSGCHYLCRSRMIHFRYEPQQNRNITYLR